jgi:protein O-mannosyl-transferase
VGSPRSWQARALVALGLIVLAALHAPLVAEDPLLNRDDQRLVLPLASVDSPARYLEAWREGRILDVQPVRDATFKLNLWLKEHTGRGHYHLTNVLLWVGCVLLTWRLLEGLAPGSWLPAVVAALFALHPVFAMSVAWVAARKHLLSCLFILLATLGLRRAASRGASAGGVLATAGAYTLSVFSQPITVLWPVWAAWEAWRQPPARRWELLRIVLACAPVAALCLWLNASYYSGAFVAQTGSEKLLEGLHVGVSLLALGRAFFNLVCPVVLATTYDPGRALNLVGLFLLVPFALWVYRSVPRDEALGWGLFALLPLAVVLGKMTNIFLFDTYLLTPGVGLACLALHLAAPLEQAQAAPRRVAAGVALLVAGFYGVHTWGVVQSWRSDASVWGHAYEVEPTPNALAKHAYYLAGTERAREAVEVALELRAEAPGHPEAAYVLARAVALDRGLTAQQKDLVLRENASEDPWHLYFHGTVRASLGDAAGGSGLMWKALGTPGAFRQELATVAAEAWYLCRLGGGEDCDGRVEGLKALPQWSQRAYEERLSRFGGGAQARPASP